MLISLSARGAPLGVAFDCPQDDKGGGWPFVAAVAIDGVAHGKLLAGDVVRSVNGVVVRSSERLSMQLKARTRLTFELDRSSAGHGAGEPKPQAAPAGEAPMATVLQMDAPAPPPPSAAPKDADWYLL